MGLEVFENYECENQMELSDLEQWKLIEGFSSKFSISNFGRVKSNARIVNNHTGFINKKDMILKQQKNHKGYPVVTLQDGNYKKTVMVHRLVAKAFIENANNKPQVNHIDGNKENNHFSNLEWCTNQENQIHAIKSGLNDHSKYRSGRKNRRVAKIDLKTNEVIEIYESINDAARAVNAKTSTNIGMCCRGLRNKANGYAWSYAEEVM